MYIVDFLQSRGIGFETLLHRPAFSATRRARNMHVTGREVAKPVLVKCGEEFVLAVLPATSRIDLSRLAAALDVEPEQVRLAADGEIATIFRDCEPGTIPPFGRLYGLKTVIDFGLTGRRPGGLHREHPARGAEDAVPRLRRHRGADPGRLRGTQRGRIGFTRSANRSAAHGVSRR